MTNCECLGYLKTKREQLNIGIDDFLSFHVIVDREKEWNGSMYFKIHFLRICKGVC